jgi:hypothetical protein
VGAAAQEPVPGPTSNRLQKLSEHRGSSFSARTEASRASLGSPVQHQGQLHSTTCWPHVHIQCL